MTTSTVALVHGAFADSSAWSGVAEALEADGHLVLAIPNPLRGLASDAAYVRAALGSLGSRVTLVGHGYGGAVIGEAARGAANVRALVFLAPYILDQGESVVSVLDPATFPGSLFGPDTTLVRAVPGARDGELWMRPADFAAVCAADAPPAVARRLALAQRPVTIAAFRERAGEPAWRAAPSWALVTEDDRLVPVAGQRWMAGRAGARTTSVAAAHAVPVTRPGAVAALVHEAATAVG